MFIYINSANTLIKKDLIILFLFFIKKYDIIKRKKENYMIYTDLPITDVCLNITEECNLACKYCFTEHHPNYMSLKVAKDSAKWLHDNSIESSKIQGKEVIPNIGFFCL